MKIELDKFERGLIINLLEEKFSGYIVEYEEMIAVKELLKKFNCSDEEIKRILK